MHLSIPPCASSCSCSSFVCPLISFACSFHPLFPFSLLLVTDWPSGQFPFRFNAKQQIVSTVSRAPWMGDQPIIKRLPIHKTRTQKTSRFSSMHRVWFDPTIPVFERARYYVPCTTRGLFWSNFSPLSFSLYSFLGLIKDDFSFISTGSTLEFQWLRMNANCHR